MKGEMHKHGNATQHDTETIDDIKIFCVILRVTVNIYTPDKIYVKIAK